MSFLETIDEEHAEGDLAVIYEKDVERVGFLPNYTRLFSLHPDAYLAWRGLIGAIARPMDERRYELATVGAAGRLRSTYCSLAHGKILRDVLRSCPGPADRAGPAVVGAGRDRLTGRRICRQGGRRCHHRHRRGHRAAASGRSERS